LIWFSDDIPTPVYDSQLTAYWDTGICGAHGEDHNWDWCGRQAGQCPQTVQTSLCESGEAELVEFNGNGQEGSYIVDGCRYFYHAQYRCIPVPETLGEDLFVGCFIDDGARDLGDMVGTRDNAATNTFALCRAACGDSTYMSLQYGGECFCSNSYGNGAQYAQVDESECNVDEYSDNADTEKTGGYEGWLRERFGSRRPIWGLEDIQEQCQLLSGTTIAQDKKLAR